MLEQLFINNEFEIAMLVGVARKSSMKTIKPTKFNSSK